jgi:hypothetical protein
MGFRKSSVSSSLPGLLDRLRKRCVKVNLRFPTVFFGSKEPRPSGRGFLEHLSRLRLTLLGFMKNPLGFHPPTWKTLHARRCSRKPVDRFTEGAREFVCHSLPPSAELGYALGKQRYAFFYSLLLRRLIIKNPQIRTNRSPVTPISSHPYTQEESSLQYSKINCQNLTISPLTLIASRPKTSERHTVCSLSLSFSRRSWLCPL